MREPQPRDQLVRLLEQPRVVGLERARLGGRPQPRRRRRMRDAGGEPGPAGEVGDRDDAAALEVEPAAVLARVPRRRGRAGSPSAAGARARTARAGAAAPGLRRASRNASGTGGPVRMPHTGRPSTTSETRISAFSCVGLSIQLADGGDATGRASARTAAWRRSRPSGRSGSRSRPARPSPARPSPSASACSSWSSSSVYQTSALSMSDDGTASRRATLPSAIHANGTGGVGDRQIEQPARRRVDHHRLDRRDVGRRHARVVQRDDRRPQARAGRGDLRRRARAGDRRAQVERAARGHGDEVGVLDHADDAAVRRDDREVADPAVEHVEQHLAADAIGRARCRRARS